MIYVGIDPGLSGAVAAIDHDGKIVLLQDTPTFLVGGKHKDKRDYAQIGMIYILRNIPRPNTAALELVHAMPGQGVTSMFTMGRGFGLWEMALVSLVIPYDKITPQRWKKTMMDGMPKEKDASRLRAQQLFPNADLKLKKHHGRADALLIAEYLRRTVR